jgi:hypothetical protein
MWVGGHHAPAALPLAKRPSAHCTRGWVDPGPAWTGAENLTPNWDSIPGPSNIQQVTIQAMLSQTTNLVDLQFIFITETNDITRNPIKQHNNHYYFHTSATVTSIQQHITNCTGYITLSEKPDYDYES